MSDTANAADLWLRARQHETGDEWDIHAEYRELAEDYADLLRDCDRAEAGRLRLATTCAALADERDAYAKAAKDALQQCDRLRVELAHLRRWRDLLLVLLGAGALLKDRIVAPARRTK